MRVLKTLAAIGFCIFFFSCIGMENTYTINDNGSGRIVFQYKISQMFKSLGKTEGAAETKEPPLPITKEDMQKAVSGVEGLRLIDVKQTEDESDIYVKGEIEFVSIDALNKSKMFEDMPVSLVNDGSKTTFVQLIKNAQEPVDKESLATYKTFFEGYELVFRINAPRKIISTNRGDISPDGQSLTYKIAMYDFMQITEKTELRVSW